VKKWFRNLFAFKWVNLCRYTAGTPHFYELDPEQARDNRRKMYVHSPKRRDMRFGGTGGGDDGESSMNFAVWTPSRDKWPAGPRGVYLLFHGRAVQVGSSCDP
jgi:hypothetical protein